MPDLKVRFEQALADSKRLPERPDNTTLLTLYALYKQIKLGDAQGGRPDFFEMVDRAKWDAWNAIKGKDNDTAMQDYINLIASLK